jgi:hypothetical protein
VTPELPVMLAALTLAFRDGLQPSNVAFKGVLVIH